MRTLGGRESKNLVASLTSKIFVLHAAGVIPASNFFIVVYSDSFQVIDVC